MLLSLLGTWGLSFADSAAFLKADPTFANEKKDMMATLLSELTQTFRPTFSERRLVELAVELQPMYDSLPKDGHGKLGYVVSRYALHRLFVKRHGWFIRGLMPSLTDFNASSFNSFLRSLAPSQLRHFLGDFETNGISLHGLSVLAATLEDLIHKEAREHLEVAYNVLDVSVGETIGQDISDEVIDTYMTLYVAGAKFENVTLGKVKASKSFLTKHTQDWPETRMWIRDVQKNVSVQLCGGSQTTCQLDFNDSLHIVERIVEGYADFNEGECKKLKATLLKKEEGETGRVRLADFYSLGLSGTWEFNEKVDYLRAIGAIDDSIGMHPRLIVPNYVSSWVNCLRASSLYAVCCRNECENLVGQLEKQIAVPSAHPDYIMRLVENLSTGTAPAPQKVSQLLYTRLDKIAANYDGKVPLHGRLFAQWMHHAFPRECPYPHEAGTTNPQTPGDWMEETGSDTTTLSEEEMRMHVLQGASVDGVEHGKDSLPWSDVEDVIVSRPPVPALPWSTTRRRLLFRLSPAAEALLCAGILLAVLVAAKYLPTLRDLVSPPPSWKEHCFD